MTSICVKYPGLPTKRWAVAVSKATMVAPTMVSCFPNPRMPTTVNGSGGALAMTVIFDPIERCADLAVAASTTTSPVLVGACPERSTSDDSWWSGTQAKPSVGADPCP